MISVTPPTLEHGLANAVKAGSVQLIVAKECPIQELLRVVARNGGMPEVEFVLAVNVSQVDAIQQASLLQHFAGIRACPEPACTA